MNQSVSHATLRTWLGRLTLCVGLFLGLVVSRPAQAALPICTITGQTPITFGDVIVPTGAPVGTLFGPTLTETYTIICDPQPVAPTGWDFKDQVLVIPASTVGNTGNLGTGVGLQIVDTSFGNANMLGGPSGLLIPYLPSFTGAGAFNTSATFTFRLVVIGTITNHKVGGLHVLQLIAFPRGSTSAVRGLLNVDIGSTAIASSTCSVTTNAVVVNLPSVDAALLSPIGTTAGSTPFNIGLNCQAGAQLYVTLTDANNAGNTTTNLTLQAGSTATGVQLQVLNNAGTLVSYGPDSSAPSNPGQFLIGPSTAGAMSIPFTARYVSTGTVGPGSVKGMSTFTMSYQ